MADFKGEREVGSKTDSDGPAKAGGQNDSLDRMIAEGRGDPEAYASFLRENPALMMQGVSVLQSRFGNAFTMQVMSSVNGGAHGGQGKSGAKAPGGGHGESPPGVLSVGPRNTAAAKDDWQVTRTDPEGFHPLIGTTPSKDSVDVKLGAIHEQEYFIDNPLPTEGHLSFDWKHSAHGATVVHGAESNKGTSAKAKFMPSRPGVALATTTLHQHGPGKKEASIDGPETTLNVPKPAVTIHKMFSKSERGEVPVVDTMQQGEELHAIVELSDVDPDLISANAAFTNHGMKVEKTTGLGGGRFEVVMKPEHLGKIVGQLKVLPIQTKNEDVVGDPMVITVEKMGDSTDYGSRPMNTADALGRVRSSWEQIYRDRNTGVDTLLGQESEKDPPPKTPAWKSFLIGAAKIALNAATAGLGARFAEGAKELLELGEGMKEFIKVVTEEGLNEVVDHAKGEADLDSPDGGAKGSFGGVKLSMKNKFHKLQHVALSKAQKTSVDRFMTSATAKANQLDAKDPGKGYEAAVQIERDLARTSGAAHDEQYNHSFQAWCSLLAKNELGVAAAKGSKTEGDESTEDPKEMAGTDMSKIVNAEKITDRVSNDGESQTRIPAEGLDKTPGVLRLELGYRPGTTTDPTYMGPMVQKSGRIEGFTNDKFMSTVEGRAIKDLEMPVIARFNDDRDGGFVIGRNEQHQFWASQDGSTTLEKRYPKGTLEEGARKLLDGEIGRLPAHDIKRG